MSLFFLLILFFCCFFCSFLPSSSCQLLQIHLCTLRKLIWSCEREIEREKKKTMHEDFASLCLTGKQGDGKYVIMRSGLSVALRCCRSGQVVYLTENRCCRKCMPLTASAKEITSLAS